MHAVAYFDGSCRHNQQLQPFTQGGWVALIFTPKPVSATGFTHHNTNNPSPIKAEWLAAEAAVDWLRHAKPLTTLTLRGDCQEVVDKINTLNPGDKTHPAYQDAKRCLQKIKNLKTTTRAVKIPRDHNHIADQLSRGLDTLKELAATTPTTTHYLTQLVAQALHQRAGSPPNQDLHYWLQAEELIRCHTR